MFFFQISLFLASGVTLLRSCDSKQGVTASVMLFDKNVTAAVTFFGVTMLVRTASVTFCKIRHTKCDTVTLLSLVRAAHCLLICNPCKLMLDNIVLQCQQSFLFFC